MEEQNWVQSVDSSSIESINSELDKHLKGEKRRKTSRFTLAALGSIPWVGGFLSASAALDAEKDQGKINDLYKKWLREHEEKIYLLAKTLGRMQERFDSLGEAVQERIESSGYLTLVRKGFRSWDQADTEEKRELIRKLLTNAGASKLCPDDLIRLFIDWIDTYHEAHFRVIREIYKNPGTTRGHIWDNISGIRPREDSADADLYKLLIRDLSTGSVIRQFRPTDYSGRFLKKPTRGKSHKASPVMKSAFDDIEPYELTELGRQFVHYTMNEVVPKIGDGSDNS